MDYRFQLYLLIVWVGLLHFVFSLEAHSGTGTIKARDTDQNTYLTGKLSRLLDKLNNKDENDLQKVAQQKAEATTRKPGISAEDMDQIFPKEKEKTQAKGQNSGNSDNQEENNDNLLSSKDRNSIEILSKVLSRLKDPSYKNSDSTGDELGTDNNESPADVKNRKEMEALIKAALTRLNEDNNGDGSNKNSFKETATNDVQESRIEAQQIREEAMRYIETRLIQTVLFGQKLGITIDDLIEDLESRATKDSKLDELEADLDTLNSKK